MHTKRAVLVEEQPEFGERQWLICGLLWIAVALLAVGPFGPAAKIGKIIFAFMFILHLSEAMYTGIRAWRAGLSGAGWFLRTMVLGSFALMALETRLRKASRVTAVR
jgi:uncharacterized membrane protein YiaA